MPGDRVKPENKLSGIIVDTCYQIHTRPGPGLLESVYEEVLFYELEKKQLAVDRQKSIPVTWDNEALELGSGPI